MLAFVRILVLYVPATSPLASQLETEVHSVDALAHSFAIEDWAKEEVNCDIDVIIEQFLAADNDTPGFYSIMVTVELAGGVDMWGEGWSEMKIVQTDIDLLTEDQVADDIVDLYADVKDNLFPQQKALFNI